MTSYKHLSWLAGTAATVLFLTAPTQGWSIRTSDVQRQQQTQAQQQQAQGMQQGRAVAGQAAVAANAAAAAAINAAANAVNVPARLPAQAGPLAVPPAPVLPQARALKDAINNALPAAANTAANKLYQLIRTFDINQRILAAEKAQLTQQLQQANANLAAAQGNALQPNHAAIPDADVQTMYQALKNLVHYAYGKPAEPMPQDAAHLAAYAQAVVNHVGNYPDPNGQEVHPNLRGHHHKLHHLHRYLRVILTVLEKGKLHQDEQLNTAVKEIVVAGGRNEALKDKINTDTGKNLIK